MLTMINYKTCDLVHEIMITSWNTNRKKLESLILIKYKKKLTQVHLDWWFVLRCDSDQILSKLKNKNAHATIVFLKKQ